MPNLVGINNWKKLEGFLNSRRSWNLQFFLRANVGSWKCECFFFFDWRHCSWHRTADDIHSLFESWEQDFLTLTDFFLQSDDVFLSIMNVECRHETGGNWRQQGRFRHQTSKKCPDSLTPHRYSAVIGAWKDKKDIPERFDFESI